MELLSSFLFFRKLFCYVFGSVPGENGYEFQINKNGFRIWINNVHGLWIKKKPKSLTLKNARKLNAKQENLF